MSHLREFAVILACVGMERARLGVLDTISRHCASPRWYALGKFHFEYFRHQNELVIVFVPSQDACCRDRTDVLC